MSVYYRYMSNIALEIFVLSASYKNSNICLTLFAYSRLMKNGLAKHVSTTSVVMSEDAGVREPVHFGGGIE